MVPSVDMARQNQVRQLVEKAKAGIEKDFEEGIHRYLCTYWALHILCFLVSENLLAAQRNVWPLFSI